MSVTNVEELQESIITELGANYDSADTNIIEELIDEYLSIASDFTNRETTDTKLYPYIKKAVISSYLARGAEGLASKGEGSLSSSFLDIETKLKKDLVSIRRIK